MQRKAAHIARDFFLVGAVVPLVLLTIWRFFFEQSHLISQRRFLDAAFLLWPTGMQILVVPHPESSFGHIVTIAIFVLENAVLYSVVALLVNWIVTRVRHTHAPTH